MNKVKLTHNGHKWYVAEITPDRKYIRSESFNSYEKAEEKKTQWRIEVIEGVKE